MDHGMKLLLTVLHWISSFRNLDEYWEVVAAVGKAEYVRNSLMRFHSWQRLVLPCHTWDVKSKVASG